MEEKPQLKQIKLSSLLSLSTEDVKRGFVKAVRLSEREGDSFSLYCKNVESFHNKFFPLECCSSAEYVCLCFLELAKGLWLLTKAVKSQDGVVKEIYSEYAGRLQINFRKRNHSGDINLKRQISNMFVHSILDRPYGFLKYDRYNKVRLKFSELKKIVDLNLNDWREALSSASGIYLIRDMKDCGCYVGSAYGKDGIWGRWSCYASDDFHGHGGDKGLIRRIGNDPSYPNNFEFSILEVMRSNCTEKIVRDRESWWKDTLRTRKNHNNNGMNEN